MYAYSVVQIFPVCSAGFTLLTPRYGVRTRSFTVSSPCGGCSAILCSCSHSHIANFRSTWYPLLLGGQKRCGVKACPMLLHWLALGESNHRPLDLWSNTVRSRTRKYSYNQGTSHTKVNTRDSFDICSISFFQEKYQSSSDYKKKIQTQQGNIRLIVCIDIFLESFICNLTGDERKDGNVIKRRKKL